MQRQFKIQNMVFIALFVALSFIMTRFFSFPLPFLPVFLKIDLSYLLAIILFIYVGKKEALLMVLMKAFLLALLAGFEVGQLIGLVTNITASLVLAVSVYYFERIFAKWKILAQDIIVGIASVCIFIFIMFILNTFIVMPLYIFFMQFPINGSIALFVLQYFSLFNFFQGGLVLLTYFLLKPMMQHFIKIR